MPDFLNTVFDYTNAAVQGTSSVLNSGYEMSKNAVYASYDASKYVGDSMYNGAKGMYGKFKDNIPDASSVENSLSIIGLGKREPAPPVTLSGLVYSNISTLLRKNTKFIEFGIAFPLIALAGHKAYRSFVPYERNALRLEGRYRYEVIIVVGSITSTFVSKLVTDLNNKGYIIFVTVSNEDELKLVEQINDMDIRPLLVDYTSDNTVKDSLLKLGNFLDSRIEGIPNESYYNVRGILVIPSYSKLPKIRKMEELSSREFNRIIDMQFSKINTMIHNGLLKFINESNNRRKVVESFNGETIKNGFSKLIFVNFMVIPENDNRRLVHDFSLDISRTFYNSLYNTSGIKLKDAVKRLWGTQIDRSLVDMTTLDVILHKNHSSRLTYGYPLIDNLFSQMHNKMSPKDIHNKIFDLLNQRMLAKNYTLEN